jgi:hypothetical protein
MCDAVAVENQYHEHHLGGLFDAKPFGCASLISPPVVPTPGQLKDCQESRHVVQHGPGIPGMIHVLMLTMSESATAGPWSLNY